MKTIFKIFFCLVAVGFVACSAAEIQRPDVVTPLMPDKGDEGVNEIPFTDVTHSTVCSASAEGAVFRIPSIVTCKDGSLVAFAELRHNSWQDKSYTDVVSWKSTDNGATWGGPYNLTAGINDGDYAFMDPTPVVDPQSGNIFLFCTRWKKLNTDATNNLAFMITSTDNGASFGSPVDISSWSIFDGCHSAGFGPGHGIAIKSGRNQGRLVVITRQYDGKSSKGYVIYSDDQGKNWKRSNVLTYAGEAQIAEVSENKLYENLRRGIYRYSTTSTNGGESWGTAATVTYLPQLDGGCHASVLGAGKDILFYCGPAGPSESTGYDNRYNLTLFRSSTAGTDWSKKKVLYEKASGYSDMTLLSDGRLAVFFEAGPEKGFVKIMGTRPAGWMTLDLIVLPATVYDYQYWFK